MENNLDSIVAAISAQVSEADLAAARTATKDFQNQTDKLASRGFHMSAYLERSSTEK